MKQAKKRQELTEQQQEFIRLLREKAEDTPVPMALQPEMILQRLPDAPPQKVGKRFKIRIPSWKTMSGVAVALGACVAVLLTGRQPVEQYLNGDLPVTSLPSDSTSVSEPSDTNEQSQENQATEPTSDLNEDSSLSGESGPSNAGTGSVVQNAQTSENNSHSSGNVLPSQPTDSSQSSSQPEGGTVTEDGTSSSETQQNGGSSQLLPNGTLQEDKTESVDLNQTTTLPSGNGEDYASVYSALQQAATPENATQQYTTAVLSAGISSDGLQSPDEKTIVATDGECFYVSTVDSHSVSILKGSAQGSEVAKIYVEFETPSFSGMSVESYAITNCFYSNGSLFVVGTVSYSGTDGKKTISAVSCYDVTNPESPRLTASSAQDGTMVGAVMSGGYLYLFSRYYPDTTVQQNNPSGYIPLFYANGEASMPSADSISISAASTNSYIVAASYSSKDPQNMVDFKILQGGGKSFFVGQSGLYLFHEDSREMETMLSGITFATGHFTITPEVTINGILSNLTPPNEYGSALRILTTSYGSSNNTHLYIFDRSLSLLGSAENLLKNSVLRSVRFDGNILYYTLYGYDGQVYELDLSNPAELSDATVASDEEEALFSIHGEGNYIIRLTGQKGHTQLQLTLGLLGVEVDSVSIPVEGGYNESDISLQYLGDGLVFLIYQQGGVDVCKLYQSGKDGLNERISVEISANENAQGYIQDGQFFLITSQQTRIFDLETGEETGQVDRTP